MSSKEALNNLGEAIRTSESEADVVHYLDLSNKIVDKELPFEEWGSEESTGALEELDVGFEEDSDDCL
jgi:hypothetical protein